MKKIIHCLHIYPSGKKNISYDYMQAMILIIGCIVHIDYSVDSSTNNVNDNTDRVVTCLITP